MGMLCLASIMLVFILQGLLAWKIINIGTEQLALEKSKAALAKDQADFAKLKQKDSRLHENRLKLVAKISKLNEIIADLEKEKEKLYAEKLEARTIIESSLASLTIEKRFQSTIDRMETVLQQSIKKMTNVGAPMVDLTRNAQDLQKIVNSLMALHKTVQKNLGQAAKEIDQVARATTQTAVALKTNMQDITEFIQSTQTSLEKISGAISGAANKVNKYEAGLDIEIKALSEQSDRFLSQIITLDNRLNEIKTTYNKFFDAATSLDTTTATLNDSAKRLSTFARTAQSNYQQWVQNKDSTGRVILEMAEKSAAVKIAGDTLLEEANTLKGIGNQLTQDAADFKKKIERFELSMTEKPIKQYKAKVSKISSKLQSDADTIYNLNFDVERELRKLLIELENLNQSIKRVQARVKKMKAPEN